MKNTLTANQLQELNKAYSNYYAREFEGNYENECEDTYAEVITNETELIGIGFTTSDTTEYPEIEVEVKYDLINFCYVNYCDGEIAFTQPATFDSFIQDLNYCSFDDMMSDVIFFASEEYERSL